MEKTNAAIAVFIISFWLFISVPYNWYCTAENIWFWAIFCIIVVLRYRGCGYINIFTKFTVIFNMNINKIRLGGWSLLLLFGWTTLNIICFFFVFRFILGVVIPVTRRKRNFRERFHLTPDTKVSLSGQVRTLAKFILCISLTIDFCYALEYIRIKTYFRFVFPSFCKRDFRRIFLLCLDHDWGQTNGQEGLFMHSVLFWVSIIILLFANTFVI